MINRCAIIVISRSSKQTYFLTSCENREILVNLKTDSNKNQVRSHLCKVLTLSTSEELQPLTKVSLAEVKISQQRIWGEWAGELKRYN